MDSPPFPCVWASDAAFKLDAQPVVKGLIERGSFVVIYGPSGSGKSFFTADISQHVATGTPWRGRRCPQGLTVYVASEAGSSILKRFVAWRDNRLGDEIPSLPLAIFTRGPNLLADVEVVKLCDQIATLQDQSGLPLSLATFDTLSRSIPGGDENKAEDMTMAIKAADYVRDRFDAATAYVHHSGKDPERGARGHSALFAAADLVLRVMDSAATVEKVRDGVAGERFPFALEPVQLGTDADGDAVMTCLLNVAEGSSVEAPKRSAPLKGRSALGMQSLREAIEAHGQAMPGSSTIPQGIKAITLVVWRERFELRYGTDDKTPVRQAFYRAREALLGARLIGISDPYVWAT